MSVFKNTFSRAIELFVYDDSIDIPFPNIVKQGTSSSTSPFKLIDSSANFSGIQVGDTILDPSGSGYAVVTSVDSNTVLSISSDIFSGAGQTYEIYQGQNGGCYIWVPYGLDYTSGYSIEVVTIGGDLVRFFNPPAGLLPVQVRRVTTSTDIFKLIALW